MSTSFGSSSITEPIEQTISPANLTTPLELALLQRVQELNRKLAHVQHEANLWEDYPGMIGHPETDLKSIRMPPDLVFRKDAQWTAARSRGSLPDYRFTGWAKTLDGDIGVSHFVREYALPQTRYQAVDILARLHMNVLQKLAEILIKKNSRDDG